MVSTSESTLVNVKLANTKCMVNNHEKIDQHDTIGEFNIVVLKEDFCQKWQQAIPTPCHAPHKR